MERYEEQYMRNLWTIWKHGKYEKNERTGIITWRLPATQIVVDLADEFPILQSKKVFWKTAADELLWMVQKQSNNINDLNSKIWNKWADPDGSIGKTYGYQLNKPMWSQDGQRLFMDQVEYVLETLRKDPSSRQAVLDMWNPEELCEMNLPPCVYSSVWNIIGGRLNCMVVQRSADYPVGVPFDTTEYAILVHLFARDLGVKPGVLTHVMGDSHIYANQIEGVHQLHKNYYSCSRAVPRLRFRQDAPTNFWEMTVDDFEIYNYHPEGVIQFEVAK